MSTTQAIKQEIISRINAELGDQIPCQIPLDQPIATHTTQEMKEHGTLAWYFLPKLETGASREAMIKDGEASLIGSPHSIKRLLASDNWVLIPDTKEQWCPQGSMQIIIKN